MRTPVVDAFLSTFNLELDMNVPGRSPLAFNPKHFDTSCDFAFHKAKQNTS